ncbi:MAG: tetratricopeptide repeat protein [Desulfobacteraceae bacterium]|nr:tetratricopeptide repeat protein [Desulfobacteraceae bacterium]
MSDLLNELQRYKALLILLVVEFFLLFLFPPQLLFEQTIIAGGDTASHYPTAEILKQRLLAGAPPVTWSHGNYAGFPLFLNYFPLPFFAAALLSFAIPMQVAFKLITLLAVIPLPLAVCGCLRRLGYRDPIPVLGSAFSLLFLLMKENSMWGGNIASTLAGEFSCGIAFSIAVYLIGKFHDDIGRNRSLFPNSVLEALIALCSGYPLLQVGFGSSYFLFRLRFVRYLLSLHALAFCLIAFWLLPLLWRLPWDTSFNHSWNIRHWTEVIPLSFLPAILGIPLGWAVRRLSFSLPEEGTDAEADRYLWWQTAIAVAGFGIAPLAGLVDIRFLPFAQLMLLLLGASGWGRLFIRLGRPYALTAAATAGILLWGAFHLDPIPGWIRWNYGGFESKPLWQSFRQTNDFLRGTENDPRVFYEHGDVHNGAGTIRAFEMLPFFSGRSTLEGLYMQSSVSSPFVFYLQSELSQAPSCPFPLYYYSRFDARRASEHLRLFNASQVIAGTDQTCEALDRSPQFELQVAFSPFRIYRLTDFNPSYAVPLRYQPFRIPEKDWKRTQFEWFRASSLDVPLVVAPGGSGDGYWNRLQEWHGDLRAMPRQVIANAGVGDVEVRTALEDNRIAVETSRTGHPLWLKVSYHPDWKIAEGSGELYLASPAFMLLVPHTPRVVLKFDSRHGIYAVGIFLSLAACLTVAGGLLHGRISGRAAADSTAGAHIPPPAIHPVVWVFLCLAVVAAVSGRDGRDPLLLYDRALQIYQESDAAGPSPEDPATAARRAEQLEEARILFARCIERFPSSPVLDHCVHFLALSFLKQERWQEAADMLLPFLESHPDSRVSAECLYHLGAAFRGLKDERASTDYFRQSLERFPESLWAKHAAARLLEAIPPEELFRTAVDHFEGEDFLRAVPILEALSEHPELALRPESARLLAYAQFHRNQWEEAAKLLIAWLNAYPSHPKAAEAWVTLGECHMHTGSYEEALQDLKNALALDPGLAGSQPFRAVFDTVEEFAAGIR